MSSTVTQVAAPRGRLELVDLLQSNKVAKSFSAVATQFLEPHRMLAMCMGAIRNTPKLKNCDPLSVVGSMMFLQSIGLEPNTPLGHAFLIPFEKRRKNDQGRWVTAETVCNVLIGYRGYLLLANRVPEIVRITANAIHQHDTFENEEGSNAFVKFSVNLRAPDRGPLIGAYSHVVLAGERGKTEFSCVLPIADIHRRRDRSETYRHLVRAVDDATPGDRSKAEWALKQTPWVAWEDEMAAKTAIRAIVKSLPISGTLQIAASVEDATEPNNAGWAALADPDAARAVANGTAAIADFSNGAPPEVQDAPAIAGEGVAPQRDDAGTQAPKPAGGGTQFFSDEV